MMRSFLSNLEERGRELGQAVQELLKIASPLPLSDPGFSASNGLTFAQVVGRGDSIAKLATDLSGQDEDKFLLASTSRLVAFRDHVGSLRDGIARLTSSLNNLEPWGGYDRIDSSGTLTTKNGQTIGMRGLLDEISSLEDNALEPYLVLASASRPRAIGAFNAAATVLTEKASEATALAADVRAELDSFRARAEAISATETTVREAEVEARRLLEETEKARRSADDSQAKVAVASESVEATRQQAANLEAEVKAYDDKFKAFQVALEEREKALERGNKQLTTLLAELGKAQKGVEDLQGKAEQMLGGATIAGLSAEYQNRATTVDDQLWWARLGFYVSVTLIALSVLVALNLIDFWGLIGPLPAMPAFDPKATAGSMAVQILAGLGSRALVILPSLLLAGFASHRHAMLFRLREEYSHKSALAASVHGFKQQAPTYQEPIAAAVFTELLANPAAAMDGKPESRPNGFLTRLVTPAVEAAMDHLKTIKGPGAS